MLNIVNVFTYTLTAVNVPIHLGTTYVKNNVSVTNKQKESKVFINLIRNSLPLREPVFETK